MVRELRRALFVLLLFGAVQSAHAQDDMLQNIYTGLEVNVRADYEALRTQLSHTAMRLALNAAKEAEELKMLSYNKAVLFASCAVESERDRAPTAKRAPSATNLMLRTCVEIKFAEMEKFSNRLAYAEVFFPERITRCEEGSRRRTLEKLLPPYGFLEIDEPKLYDFARYNQCLMTP